MSTYTIPNVTAGAITARTNLYLSLKDAVASAAIGSDQFVYSDAGDPRRCLSPDAFVKLGAREGLFDSWKIWERGAPDLAVEIVSASDHSEAEWTVKLERYQASGIREGMVLVSAMHITAGVFVNDHEPGLWSDIWAWLQHLAPEGPDYQHHRTGEDNGDAHLKSILVHHEVIVPVTKARLDLGPWQQVFYAEFDGQRDKRLVVKIGSSILVDEKLGQIRRDWLEALTGAPPDRRSLRHRGR